MFLQENNNKKSQEGPKRDEGLFSQHKNSIKFRHKLEKINNHGD